MKRLITSATNRDTEYEVAIEFNGYVGSDVDLTVYARKDADEEELLYIVQEDYAYELLDGEVVEADEEAKQYEVEVTFDSQIGTSETYSVYADDEDEAIAEAIEAAIYDIEIVEFREI